MNESQEEYLSLDEAAASIGLKRVSLYHYLEKLGLEPTHFENNKHAYLTSGDVERIKQVREKPWKVSKQVPSKRRQKKVNEADAA